jgi:serine/threonine-protein kinase
MSMPSSSGTSVTQELELVYWKDVKDSSDPEDLQGFLEKFPTGIYADLARRRLRKLAGAEGTTNISAVGSAPAAAGHGSTLDGNSTSTMFPDYDATRARAEAPAANAVATGTGLKPSDWIDQEYTRTRLDSGFAATVAEQRPEAAPPPGTAAKPVEDEAPLPRARKKPPLAVLAGIGGLAAVGIVLAMLMGRGGDKTLAAVDTPPLASAPVARASKAAPAPADVPTVVVIAPQAAPQPAPQVIPAGPPVPAEQMVLVPTPAPAVTEPAPRPRAKASQPRASSRNAQVVAAEPAPRTSNVGVLPRVEPEPPPRALPPVLAAAANSNYQAVDQCRDRMFLAKEICLADHCDKAGARNHPLCVKRREEIRVREESRANRGPQQPP